MAEDKQQVQMGRRYGEGLWLAADIEDAMDQLAPICAHTGYRRRDVCIWRRGSSPTFWVCEPNGTGGIACGSLDEAIELRRQLTGGRHPHMSRVRKHGHKSALTRSEAQRILEDKATKFDQIVELLDS